MKQRLIVEGNDAIVLAIICQLRWLPPPKVYEDKLAFIKEFVQVAGGHSKVNAALGQLLADTAVQNIGAIVDANEVGPQKRWETLKGQLAHVFPNRLLSSISPNASGSGWLFQHQFSQCPAFSPVVLPNIFLGKGLTFFPATTTNATCLSQNQHA